MSVSAVMFRFCPWWTHVEHSLCLSSLQATVTQTRERLCFVHNYGTHMSQGAWIMLQLMKAKVFLQDIGSLQYGLMKDRRPEADWEGQCLLARGCSFHVVILSGQSRCTRHMMTPFGATEFTDKVANFHPYCPVMRMKNGPSAVLECAGVLEMPAATAPLLAFSWYLVHDLGCAWKPPCWSADAEKFTV